jgi:ATP-binding cassette subfamily B protein
MRPEFGAFKSFGRGMRSFLKDPSVKQARLRPGLVRRVVAFAAPYKHWLGAYLALIVLDALISVTNPFLYRQIIDAGILRHERALIVVLALVLVALAVADGLLALSERYLSARIGEGLIYDMRTRVFAHVQRMPIGFFSRAQTGALVSRLNNDVIGAQQAFTDILSSVAGNALLVALTVAAMAVLSWQVTLVALALFPLFIWPAKRIGRRLQRLTAEAYNLNADMNAMMTERFNVAGALLVKLFGDYVREERAFSEKAARVRDIGVATALVGRVLFVSLAMVSSLATAFVYGWGGLMAADGSLRVGTLVALTALLNRLYFPLISLSNVTVDVMSALVSFDRVFEVLDLKPMVAPPPVPKPVDKERASLEFRHVSFRYPRPEEVSLLSLENPEWEFKGDSAEVLHDVSFKLEPGQMGALVGPSGAGKTTVTYLAARLYDPTRGQVLLNGVDLREISFEDLKELIGVVPQDPHLFHDTLRNNLLYVKPDASEEELWEVLEEAQIAELVRSLPEGLDTVVGERGYRLSGGEKQRVAAARVLLKSPPFVILDEATSHLDSRAELLIQRAFERALSGRTSLVIAHRLSTIMDADVIFVLKEGRVVESGGHEELLKRGGLYASLFQTQFMRAARFGALTSSG